MVMTSSDYVNLFDSCVITTDLKKLKELDYICRVIQANQRNYSLVQSFVRIPWPLIACIHFRESNLSFKCHLHNGDSLMDRTMHIPRGRPVKGDPPFTWTESAIDALSEVWLPNEWKLPGCLEFLERYNGLGYQKKGINSPYLWDYTNHYDKGLYVSDNQFNPDRSENRPGCVALIKSLNEKGLSFGYLSLVEANSSLH